MHYAQVGNGTQMIDILHNNTKKYVEILLD